MAGQTFLPDLGTEAELADARAEFDAALSVAALAAWAERWGAAALEALEDFLEKRSRGRW